MFQKLALIILVVALVCSTVPANSKGPSSTVKPEVYFYSGFSLIIYSFVSPIRYDKLKTVVNPYTGEEEEMIIHYQHPRWVELVLGLILHQIGSNLLVINDGLAYKIEF